MERSKVYIRKIKTNLRSKNWKIKDFAEHTDIAYCTLQRYVGGEPNAKGMVAIVKAGVNLNWLVSGQEEMFQIATQEIVMSKQEEKLLKDYRIMSENLKEAFSMSFKEISEKQ